MTEISALEQRYRDTKAGYHKAANDLAQAIEAVTAERTRAFYPQATALDVHGYYNEGGGLNLRVVRVRQGETVLVCSDTGGYDECHQCPPGEELVEDDDEGTFDSLRDEIEGDLDWLIEITGDDWLGRQEIDFAMVSAPEPWCHHDPPAVVIGRCECGAVWDPEKRQWTGEHAPYPLTG